MNTKQKLLICFLLPSLVILQCASHLKNADVADIFPAQVRTQLFDDKCLTLWQPVFEYSGTVNLSDSLVTLHRGGYLTGITWNGPVPRKNYEIELDAKRIEGLDFFCGLTFPVGDSFASLILGGWGGFTTGISSINGIDASENGTADVILFEKNTWYHVRLRVTPHRIQAWVDDRNIVDLDTTGKSIAVRRDVEESTPLSLMTYNTTGAFKTMTLKRW